MINRAKKLFKLFRPGFIAVLLLAAFPLVAQAEKITSFEAYITVQADGGLEVREVILYDFESAIRHGIYRTIDATHPGESTAWYKKRLIEGEVKSVLRNGQPETYVEEDGGALSLKIGDADKEITGPHLYEIYYTLDGAIFTTEEGVTELYWNATGNRWDVPMEKVNVYVSAAEGVTLGAQNACYAGRDSSENSCTSASSTATSTTFQQNSLAPGEELTIAQALDFEQALPAVIEKWDWFLIWTLVVSILVPGLIFIGGIFLAIKIWLTYRKHYFASTVVAQYEAYQNMSPLYTGVLADGRLDQRDVTAALVSLAERGFLTIEYVPKEKWWNSEDYKITMKKAPDASVVPAELDVLRLLFAKVEAGEVIELSTLEKSTAKRKANAKLYGEVSKAVKADLEKEGFFETVWKGMISRRTRRGYEASYHLQGLKEFLSVTEKERYAFHNAPKLNSDTFMELLPFAIALGVDKEWAEAFKDIPLEMPDWYKGDGNSFSPAVFSSHMNGLTAAVASGTTTPSSGGSGGGGFSGGGAGGGGGGSW